MNLGRLKRFVGRYLGHDADTWNKWFVSNIVEPLNKMVEVDLETVVAKDDD